MSDVSAAAPAAAAVPAHPRSAWHDPSGFGFRDILDIVNPLQHLPIVSSIYRWLTGDRPGDAAKIAGDALYGGPIGLAFGVVGAAIEDKQGHDVGEQMLSAVFGSHDHATAVADAAPAAVSPPPAAPALVQTAAVTPPAPAAVQNPAVPDHPPIPLYRNGPPPGMVSNPPDPARALIDHNAALERQISAGTRSNPIPLVPPAGALPAARVSGPAVAPPNASTPLDISQKMLDALDKYMKLEKERNANTTQTSVDYAL